MRSHRKTSAGGVRNVIFVVLMAAIATATAAAISVGASAQTAAFDADVHVEAWVELWRTYDLSAVDDLFLQDDRVTYFSSEREGLIVGIDAVREHHAGFGFVAGGRDAASELWVEEVQVSDFGGSAVVGAFWYFGNRDDRGSAQRGPMTAVWVATEDGHRIAHMHFAGYE